MADVRLRPGRLDRINVQNDPVNLIDPWGLERISFNGVMRNGLNQIRTGIHQTYDILINDPLKRVGEEMRPGPLNERVKQLNDRINWQTDHSGLKETLNATPLHPMMWEKDVIWWAFVWYWDEDYKFLEPWGHPFFPDDECHH